MLALDLAIPRPRGPRALRWMGDQRIWRLAVFSSNLDVCLVARSSGVRRRAPAKTTAPPNKASLDPSHASLSLASPAADPEMVCSDLAGMATAPSISELFVPRIRRRRGRAPLRLCSSICGLLQELRRRRWSFHRRCSRAAVPWCKVCGSWWRIRRDFIDFVVWSTGFGADRAWVSSRSTRHSDSAPLVTGGIFFDSQSLFWRWCDLGLLGSWWLRSSSGVLWRRRKIIGLFSVAGRFCRDLVVFSIFYRDLSAFVLGHLCVLEFSRDFCIYTLFVLF